MLKQKLILKAVEAFHKEWKILTNEKKLLEERENLCFQRFLARCNKIHDITFFERWNHVGEFEEGYSGEMNAKTDAS